MKFYHNLKKINIILGYLVILSFVPFLMAPPCGLSDVPVPYNGPINNNDSLILLELFKANNLDTTEIRSRIYLGQNGRVIFLELDSLSIFSLPDDIGNLEYLSKLSLNNNFFL